MRILILMFFCAVFSFSAETIDCNIIFEQRKGEILKELDKINEQQQALQALQNATQNILEQKEAELKKREEKVAKIEQDIKATEEKINKMLKKNEEILKQIQNATKTKVGEAYTSMKDSKSAAILENLPEGEAANILFGLDTKVASKILAKMNPQKAATLTQLIVKGPPFTQEEAKQEQKLQTPKEADTATSQASANDTL
ncbi:MotE family protein [Helicobacter burdigaliensis]|uniref:MotE family protein n=1 Tax=Helicobacter burdigaliensis TaxID=2315334 RepID=UPI000EF6F297|nr:MotE family protein [Helicobacter burdigaliensis]